MALRLTAVLNGEVRNEIEMFGVEKSGQIDYGIDGIVGGHNGILHYFRACADDGTTTVVFAAFAPSDLTVLHRLMSHSGSTVRQVNLLAKRQGPSFAPKAGAVYANLELEQAQVSVRRVAGDSGRTWYLVNFVSGSGKGRFTHNG